MQIEERDFFRDRFTEAELRQIIDGRPAACIFSQRSPSFRKLGLDAGSLSEDELIRLMLDEPRMIKRPLILIGGRLIAGSDKSARAEIEEAIGQGA